MNIWVYDVEVFKYDWTLVARKYNTKEYISLHNDRMGLINFLNTKDIVLAGFNNKFYDDHILKAIYFGLDNKTIKEVSDIIVTTDIPAWEIPVMRNLPFYRFKSFDIMSDMQLGNSLDSIAGNLGMDIVQSSIPFDINRPLTEEELKSNEIYNKSDVDITHDLITLRRQYLNTKLKLGRRLGLEDHRSLFLSNAGLSAEYLGANRQHLNDMRTMPYPDTLDWSKIPKEVKDLFDQIYDKDKNIDQVVKTSCTIKMQDMNTKYAWGGVHGALNKYVEYSTEDRVIMLYDVASLYPSLMIEYNLLSRAVMDSKGYSNLKTERIELKAKGLFEDDNANKLVLNITYGASLLKSNKLYDERNGRSTCVHGQLLMTDLVNHYLDVSKSIKLINFNTDGIMFSILRSELDKIEKINEEWQKRTRLVLEGTEISRIYQKDVNNYVMIEPNGKLTTKGGYFSMGETRGGSWSINNQMLVVKKAMIDFFVNGTDPAVYIENENRPFEYQIIAKAGMTYDNVLHIVNGKPQVVQKVNRVFASKDKSLGTLLKVHKEKINNPNYIGDKIASLPDHNIIDNKLSITIDKIDKEWYTELAWKRIEDSIGKRNLMSNEHYLKRLEKIGKRKR